MADALFRNDLPLEVDDVRRILVARFPQLGPAAVGDLGAGWDFTAFEVNGEWVFRFPKRKWEQARLLLDRRIRPDLAPRLRDRRGQPTGDRITAVIDWGDMGLGDPAVDFAAFGYWLGLGFVRRGMLQVAADDLRYCDPSEREALFARARRAIDDVLAEEDATNAGSATADA